MWLSLVLSGSTFPIKAENKKTNHITTMNMLNSGSLLIKCTVLVVLATLMIACSDTGDADCQEQTWYQDLDNDGLGNAAISLSACEQPSGYVADNTDTDDTGGSGSTPDDYSGTASVSQGGPTITTDNLLDCGRTAALGTVTSTDGNSWTVPAAVNYDNSSFPFASDLHNPCNGNNYANASAALTALDGSDIVEIDADGEVITAYVFADNYFEMYVNGIPVGKDNVPFTQFNSDLVRFRVNRPFTVAMKLVDWEENLGLGTEASGSFAHHPGDGGMVAVFKDASDNIIDITNDSWKAQTFYTAPIKDLSCLTENGTERLSANCDTSDSNDGSGYYAVHWVIPVGWTTESFDDSTWPAATTYTNNTIGVDNKSAYTNFTDIFDASGNDAQFIWSTNVVLDNEVIVRKRIQ
jgi:hypothetical protein